MAELDAKIEECNVAGAISDDRLRAVFPTFRMEPPPGMPDDPFSAEYRERQMALYRSIAGKEYALANEATVFDVAREARRPFPYSTQSGVTAGEHLMAVGFLLRCMALPAGSRVLEMGFGWGNSTLALALLGHQVTAVDVEPRFCELLERRVAREELVVEIVNSDFLWVEDTTQRFDAAVFFEAFHHCDDHLRLLRALSRVVEPQGRLFLAAEPIQPDFPYPWGLRLDGQSLWSIRKHGWLELGFNSRYFDEALARTGWFGMRHHAGTPGWLNVLEARRREHVSFRYTAEDLALCTQIGQRVHDAIVIDGTAAGAALFGPYLTLPAGQYVARISFSDQAPRRGRAVMDVCASGGADRLAQRVVEAPDLAELEFAATEEVSGVEVRLFCDKGSVAEITAMEIRFASPR